MSSRKANGTKAELMRTWATSCIATLADLLARGGFALAKRSCSATRVVVKRMVEDLPTEWAMTHDVDWVRMDQVYTGCRRALGKRSDWRYGTRRVHEVAREAYDVFRDAGAIRGKTYCDIGCGTFHPFGVSAVMYLNGVNTVYAVDQHVCCDHLRAGEALVDLLADCILRPNLWRWSDVSEEVFRQRIQGFDINRLLAGQLDEAVPAALHHVVSDVRELDLPPESIDLMSSRAVLEHFPDFESAMRRLFTLLRPGAIAVHAVDLVDHRAYRDARYHYWSFLEESDDWTDGVVNRLRWCEMQPILERVGYELVSQQPTHGMMPPGFLKKVRPRFREMSESELRMTGVTCVLRRPKQTRMGVVGTADLPPGNSGKGDNS